MINQSSSSSPSYAQAHPIYNAYVNTIPITSAATTALFTPGNRVDKTKSGLGSLTYWLGFEQMDRFYQRGLHRFYEKHPKVADTINQNPIMLGIPLMMLGLVPDMIAATALQTGADMVMNHPKVDAWGRKLLYSDGGNHVADTLRPFEKKANTPIVRKVLAAAFIGISLYLIVRAFLDAKHFGHDYRQARQQNPNASPYDLEAGLMNSKTNS
jgi:hypothetical protein